jgi:hypothetical protein
MVYEALGRPGDLMFAPPEMKHVSTIIKTVYPVTEWTDKVALRVQTAYSNTLLPLLTREFS